MPKSTEGMSKVPLHPFPVISEPFRRLAFDLVGPLPNTKHCHKFILTSMCLTSKYHEVVPLKKVDSQSVAEAMLDIFSRCGIPNELLMDQGSVFVGKLMTQLCE